MGKAKRTKGKAKKEKRFNPSAGRKGADDEGADDGNGAFVPSVPILARLDAAAAEEREAACQAVSQLCMESEENTKILLAAKSVPRLMEKIFDPDVRVRVAALGALRNLSLAGGTRACDELVRGDVINSLVIMFKKCVAEHSSEWMGPEKKQLSAEAEPIVDTLTQVFALLWNLCEGNAQATDIFSRQSDVHALAMDGLANEVLPLSFRVTVGHFLCVVTDANNSQALRSGPLSKPETATKLSQLMANTSHPPILSAIACCVHFNLFGEADEQREVAHIAPVLSRLLAPAVLDGWEPAVTALLAAARKLQPVEEEGGDAHLLQFQDPPELETWRNHVVAQQLCVEVFANVLARDDFDEEEGEMEVDEMDEEGAEGAAGVAHKGLESVPPHVQQLLSSLLPLMPTKVTGLPDSAVAQLAALPPVLQQRVAVVESLQARALTCLTNAMSVVGTTQAAKSARLTTEQLWAGLWGVCGVAVARNQPGLTNGCVTAMWTFVKADAVGVAADAAQLNALSQLALTAPEEETRIACAGLFGAMASRPFDPQLHNGIAEVLSKVLAHDASVMVVVEALNSVFDAFAEPEYNAPFVQHNMMQGLRGVAQSLPARVRGQRMSRDDHEHVQEAILNLKRFIKYKQQQGV